METKRIVVKPYLSCFFSVYSSGRDCIKLLIDRPMTEEEANREKDRITKEHEAGRIV